MPTRAADWLRLALTRGVGPRTGRELVTAAGNIERVWRLPEQAPETRPEGIRERLIRALAERDPEPVERILEACRARGIRLLCPDDDDWPPLLEACPDAPLVLFALGDVRALKYPRMLAVVGARRATREGTLLTRRWCRFLSDAGVAIASGMAWGIDSAAHGGTLEGPSPTIAVLGQGLAADVAPEQQRQIEAVAAQGCVISEFPPDTRARPEHFPRRNRIIAGLAAGTLVMEADVRSGSLITARFAADYGREVMAVPGSVLNGRHAGCHALIAEGATLVESAEDVMRTMGWRAPHPASQGWEPADPIEAAIAEALAREIMHVDALAEHCGLTVSELSPILLALELAGVVEQLPGGRYALGARPAPKRT